MHTKYSKNFCHITENNKSFLLFAYAGIEVEYAGPLIQAVAYGRGVARQANAPPPGPKKIQRNEEKEGKNKGKRREKREKLMENEEI